MIHRHDPPLTTPVWEIQTHGLEWMVGAPCNQIVPDEFFPERGSPTRVAKRICTGCDVKAECLEYALANGERFGVWGGLSERERRALLARADVA